MGGAGQFDRWFCSVVSVVLSPRKNEGEPYGKEEYVELCTLPYKEEFRCGWRQYLEVPPERTSEMFLRLESEASIVQYIF